MPSRAVEPPFIHATAIVAPTASVGNGTKVWAFAQIREDAVIGVECNVGTGAYVGAGVVVGDRCKIENNASLFEGLTVERGVFIGPHVVFTNDQRPRATNPDGSLQTVADWTQGHGTVREGASVGAGAIILPGVEIGRSALVGAGAVVTRDVPPHGVVLGNPARLGGYVCLCGLTRTETFKPDKGGVLRCNRCRKGAG